MKFSEQREDMNHTCGIQNLSDVRIVLLGSRNSGKSSSGNTILGREEFDFNRAAQCVTRHGEVAGRKITVVEAPGWCSNRPVEESTKLLRQEIVLSLSMCPPGPHAVLVVVNRDMTFTEKDKDILVGYLMHLSERVWSHTIVLFTFGDSLGDTTIERHIESEGEALQWLVKKCGHRYHVFNNQMKHHKTQILELLEKIEKMLAGSRSRHLEMNITLLHEMEERRRMKSTSHLLDACICFFRFTNGFRFKQELEALPVWIFIPSLSFCWGFLRVLQFLLSIKKHAGGIQNLSDVRIVLLGSRNSGKSSSGNTILGREEFDFNRAAQCVTRHGEVAGRKITVVEAPGWCSNRAVEESTKLLRQEIVLSLSMCPPGPHAVMLLINGDKRFTEKDRKILMGYQNLLSDDVWSHVIVLFTFGDSLGDTTVERHIESEGKALQWLVEKCGRRYHVFNNQTKHNGQVMELLEKIDKMVEGNGGCHLEMDLKVLQMQERRRKEEERSVKRRMQVSKQREDTRKQSGINLNSLSELGIVLLGSRNSGKSSSGNTILGIEEFDNNQAIKCGDVAGRKITVVEAPGWCSDRPVEESTKLLKQEIVVSVSMCPPGPHAVLVVVNGDRAFRKKDKQILAGYLNLLSERVWRHSIVLFTFGDSLGDKTIERHIESEGVDLHWLVEKCGNRYHVFNNNKMDDESQVKELLEKIDEMVAANRGCRLQVDKKHYPEAKERKVEEVRSKPRMKDSWFDPMQSSLRTPYSHLCVDGFPPVVYPTFRKHAGNLNHLSEVRIVLVGCRTAGKSSSGNTILGREEFDLKESAQCVKRHGEVSGRKITVVEAPGFCTDRPVDNGTESLQQEIVKSWSMCPPGPHAVLLVVNGDKTFTEKDRTLLEGYLNLLSDNVWSHTIVLFAYGDSLGETTIERHIESEGEDLQWLVEKCGNRYQVFNNNNTDDESQVTELLEKIEVMVAGQRGSHLEMDSKTFIEAEVRKSEEDERSRQMIIKAFWFDYVSQLQMQSSTFIPQGRSGMATFPWVFSPLYQKQPGGIQNLSDVRIVLLGSRNSGKSSSGNTILGREEFDFNRAAQCVTRHGEVAGRKITVVEAPGWCSNRPVEESTKLLRQEIVLSLSMCPPGPHAVLVVVKKRWKNTFTEQDREILVGYQNLLSDRVWSHTIVLFTFGDSLGDTTTERHIETEGEALQWLVKKCGHRYHVFNNQMRRNTQVMELLEKIDEMVGGNSGCHLDADTPLLQEVKEKRREEDERSIKRMIKDFRLRLQMHEMSFTSIPHLRLSSFLSPLSFHPSIPNLQHPGADFADMHRETLIQRISSIMEIADCLKSKNMISDEMYNNIQVATPPQNQMRELYKHLDSGGRKVKAEFYQILKQKHRYLVEDLEQGSPTFQPSAFSALPRTFNGEWGHWFLS